MTSVVFTSKSLGASLPDWMIGTFNNHESVWQQEQEGIAIADRFPVRMVRVFEKDNLQPDDLINDHEEIHRIQLSPDPVSSGSWLLEFVGRDGVSYEEKDCDFYLRPNQDIFTGNLPSGCTGNPFFDEIVSIDGATVSVGPKGWSILDHESSQTLLFRKIRFFKGWWVIQSDHLRQESAGSKPLFTSGVRLHNEGDRWPLLTSDGADSGYILELAQLTYQSTGVPILKLGLIDATNGDTFTYAWTSPDATRIGINLRWLQVGLTAEKVSSK